MDLERYKSRDAKCIRNNGHYAPRYFGLLMGFVGFQLRFSGLECMEEYEILTFHEGVDYTLLLFSTSSFYYQQDLALLSKEKIVVIVKLAKVSYCEA